MTTISFRVYPASRHGHYFTVRIFQTQAALARYYLRTGGTVGRWTKALTWHHRVGKQLGELLFSRRFLERRGNTAIAHESAHAALSFARAQGFAAAIPGRQPCASGVSTSMAITSPEERFCYALGEINRHVVAGCYEAGIYR